ncbi:MAG: efflux transporter outer membrane subunit [Spirochaetia bacterium]|nr:efflux transporter outer membrane subunit [Spirochaetia bacterium]
MRVLFLAFLAMSTGCAVGPDYNRSNPQTPTAWRGAQQSGISVNGGDISAWWKEFKDPLLSSMIEKALTSSPDIRLAIAKIREARASRGVVATGLWPSLDANGTYTRSHSPAATASSGSVKTASNQFKAGLETSWELDIWGRLRRNVEASDAEIDASIEDARGVQVTLVADIATAYANYRGFQRQLEIARRNLETQTKTTEIIEKRYKAGYTNGLDISNAEAQVASTRSQIPQIESALVNASNSLSLLIGKDAGPLMESLATEPAATVLPPDVPIGLPSDLLQRRPDIRRSEAQIHAATARVGVAKGDYFPKFALTGSAGYTSSDYKRIGHPQNMFWSFGPSISMPLFDIAKIRWNVEASEAIQDQALIGYEKTVLVAFGEVETSLVAYANEKEHQKYLQIAVEKNRRAVELANKLYLAGKADFLTLGSAQTALHSAETSLAASERDLMIDLVALYKALGGGWAP